MRWTIILEDENKEPVLNTQVEFDSEFLQDFTLKFQLLKYLDPYGDAVFNRLQMDDLITDLTLIQNKEENQSIRKIIILAEKCKLESQTYLVFYGD